MEYPQFRIILDRDGSFPDDPLLAAYGGALRIRSTSPSLVGNFVSTADGVVAFGNAGGEGAGAVSLHSRADRFIMALLRTSADVVLIGASTMRDDLSHQWTAATVMPDLADELSAFRARLTGSEQPVPLAVVTASGRLPAGHPALTKPAAAVLILTTAAGRVQLPPLHGSVRVLSLADSGPLSSEVMLTALRTEIGAMTILSEGGPRVFGRLLADECVDELFLTVAPHLGGRSAEMRRPGLVEEVAFIAGATPQLSLLSLRQSGDHLFLRYGVGRRR